MAKAGTNFVFVYETLQDPRLRFKVLHHAKPAYPGVLVGYREVSLDTMEGKDYHTVIPFVKSHVSGSIFKIDEKELDEIDKWEDEYTRTKLLVRPDDEKGSPFYAWVYVLKPEVVKWK